jgi:hypothetical protein
MKQKFRFPHLFSLHKYLGLFDFSWLYEISHYFLYKKAETLPAILKRMLLQQLDVGNITDILKLVAAVESLKQDNYCYYYYFKDD